MNFANTDISLARELDAQDELASFRDEFVIDDPNLIYLDGNSLGRLPKRTVNFMRNTIEQEWGKRLIRVWNDGWINTPLELGAKIARLVGAQTDEILVTDATSINLFKLAVASLQARPNRTGVVSDVLNFPSDLYILQGIIDLFGRNHHLKLIPSADGITIAPEAVDAAIDNNTALVSLTHVAFKSPFKFPSYWTFSKISTIKDLTYLVLNLLGDIRLYERYVLLRIQIFPLYWLSNSLCIFHYFSEDRLSFFLHSINRLIPSSRSTVHLNPRSRSAASGSPTRLVTKV